MAKTREASLLLRLLTPTGIAAEEHCDSVNLILPDGKNGRGGGSLGIRKGHLPAVIALAAGPVTARLRGQTVSCWNIPGGFASVENDVITVIADKAEKL